MLSSTCAGAVLCLLLMVQSFDGVAPTVHANSHERQPILPADGDGNQLQTKQQLQELVNDLPAKTSNRSLQRYSKYHDRSKYYDIYSELQIPKPPHAPPLQHQLVYLSNSQDIVQQNQVNQHPDYESHPVEDDSLAMKDNSSLHQQDSTPQLQGSYQLLYSVSQQQVPAFQHQYPVHQPLITGAHSQVATSLASSKSPKQLFPSPTWETFHTRTHEPTLGAQALQPQSVQQDLLVQPTRLQHYYYPDHEYDGSTKVILHLPDTSDEKEHLAAHMAPSLDLSKMTNEEMTYHFFKMHDLDNNDKLDGLELINELLHLHVKMFGVATKKRSQGDVQPEPGLIGFTDEELSGIIDPVLQIDDANDDGFIDYSEFKIGQKKSGAVIDDS